MTVQIYVGHDYEDRVREPAYSHEILAIREICAQLWRRFHTEEKLYVLIFNPQQTALGREISPDLVVLTELGIGVVELKSYSNHIDCGDPGGVWYAGPIPIGAGQGYVNPHQQVQDYAVQIREDLISGHWLPGAAHTVNDLKFFTAVCFTHPDADIQQCKETAVSRYRPGRELRDWEKFSIPALSDIALWAASLRFEQSLGFAYGHSSYGLSKDQLRDLATEFFCAGEWTEMVHLMPASEAYAYILLTEAGRTPIRYRLERDELLIGREVMTCGIPIPESYKHVGREHARIRRTLDGVFIEEIGEHKIFIDEKRITSPARLAASQRITLGSKTASEEVCLLQFIDNPARSPKTWPSSTISSIDIDQ